MLTAAAFGIAFGITVPVVAAVLCVAIDAVERACRADGTRTIVRGLAWGAARFAFGAATVDAWDAAAGDRRRAARVRKLLSK